MKRYLTDKVQSEFVNEVEDAYGMLKHVGQNLNSDNLKRGYAKTASGFLEDAFATMIFKHIIQRSKKSKQYFALVDWPITWGERDQAEKKPGSKRHRPPSYRIDFMLCRKCIGGIFEIVYMAELKTNIGFIRGEVDSGSICADLKKRIRNLKKSKNRHSRSILEDGDDNQEFVVADTLKFDLVVYSSCNSGSEANVRKMARLNNHSLSDDAVWTHVLCDLDKMKGQIPHANDFNNLENRIRMCMKS